MSEIEELRPATRNRIIDLVGAAGVDTSEWADFKGGADKAATNPKFCYEWAFIEADKLVVLNLWYASMQERDGEIFQDLNQREVAARYAVSPRKPAWERRSLRMDTALQAAVRGALPVRVVVCDGTMRDIDDSESGPSRVERRMLDPKPWAVTSYDWATGACTVTRDREAVSLVDQFSLRSSISEEPDRREVHGKAFVRSAEVRNQALFRAGGRCDWCSQMGFATTDGRVFLETHHVIPLAEGGKDTLENVVALCPNHHREAHYGAIAQEMRQELLARASRTFVTEPSFPADAL